MVNKNNSHVQWKGSSEGYNYLSKNCREVYLGKSEENKLLTGPTNLL